MTSPLEGRAGGWGKILKIERAVIDFPQPDSPTRANVFPGNKSKERASTTQYFFFFISSSVVRFLTERMGLFMTLICHKLPYLLKKK